MTALPSHVQELADRVATGHGVEVLELGLRGQGRGRVLSVVIDAEEPVEADVVELVSKAAIAFSARFCERTPNSSISARLTP